MRIITRKRLNDFAEKHPDVTLKHWYQLAKGKEFKSFAELQARIKSESYRLYIIYQTPYKKYK